MARVDILVVVQLNVMDFAVVDVFQWLRAREPGAPGLSQTVRTGSSIDQ